jgi:hypothetical protein
MEFGGRQGNSLALLMAVTTKDHKVVGTFPQRS